MAGLNIITSVLPRTSLYRTRQFFHVQDMKNLRYITTDRPTVGFVGLGNMGSKMAENLLKKDENLLIYDTQPHTLQQYTSRSNVTVAKNLKELAENSSYIITMLPDSQSVWATYTSEDGIFKNCSKKETIFIDSSTSDLAVVQKLWNMAKENGRLFMDAPVSGGVIGAEAGTLTFMVGGCETIPEEVESLLLKMGARVISCGPSGMGAIAKLCNNLLLGTTMAALAEVMNLGIKCGLDAKILASVINTSSGRCWSSEIYNPVPGILENSPSNRDYQAGFKTNLLVKDMKMVLTLPEQVNSQLTLTKKALDLYNEAIRTKNIGNDDFSVIYKVISENKE